MKLDVNLKAWYENPKSKILNFHTIVYLENSVTLQPYQGCINAERK